MKTLSKNAKNRKEQVLKVIKNNYFINDRIDSLQNMDFSVDEKAMGSGGVGQIKEVKGCYRMQIGYGRHNYAFVVYLQTASFC